ncbi:MAG: ROK family protein [Magnetococcales bacterium]|nr:ROK family protein [Magnetococcales bacterium]
MTCDYRLGIDLGGTKIEGCVLDGAGKMVARRRVPTPQGQYRQTVETIASLVFALEEESGHSGLPVGVGTPGALIPGSGILKNANSVCLIGQPLGADLASVLGRPVRLANDADCFALSEAVDGAGRGYDTLFGVILGTGVGGGIVIGGRLLQGPNAIAGEWGHNPLPWPREDELPGPACYCGRRGCVETFLSGHGLAAWWRVRGGAPCSAEEIAALHHRDSLADHCLQAYCDRLARALSVVINILDPHVIVLGGGLSRMTFLYDLVPALWSRYVFSNSVLTALLPARFGDASGVRGAARLWP